jgi:hypothetical protein
MLEAWCGANSFTLGNQYASMLTKLLMDVGQFNEMNKESLQGQRVIFCS